MLDLGARASVLSPVTAYEERRHLFYADDNSLCFGWVCRPLSGGDDRLDKKIRSMLEREYPAGTFVQGILIASPNLERTFERSRSIKSASGEALDTVIRDRREEFFRSAVDEPFDVIPSTHLRDFQFLLCVKLPIEPGMPTLESLDETALLRSSIEEDLKSIGLSPITLDAGLWLTIMSVLLNRDPEASWRHFGGVPVSQHEPLNEQIVDFGNPIEVDASSVQLGPNAMVRFMSPKAMPESLFFGQSAWLINDLLSGTRGIRSPFFLSFNIFYPDDRPMREKAMAQRAYAMNAASGSLARWVPQIRQKFEDWDILSRSMDAGGRPVRAMLSFGIYGRDPQETERHMSAVRTYAAEQGFVFNDERSICLPLLINCLPFGADRDAVNVLYRYRLQTTQHASRLLPVFGDWQGTGTPVVSLVGRSGQHVSFDLFDSGTNYNLVIAAESGAGKSFFANDLITSYLACGAQIWVVDIGGSYRNLNRSLGGEYLDFGTKERVSLNPFPLVQDFKDEADVLIRMVAAMISPDNVLGDFQQSVLAETMRDLWEDHLHDLTIDKIEERLKGNRDQRVVDLGTQLFEFTSRGGSGGYFSGKNTVDFRNRFTVLELEGLQGRKHLQRIVLLQLIFQIQQAMYLGDRGRRKLVIIDEAWDLLSDGEVGRFIEHGYRRFRKYGGAAVTITQSVSDLFQTNVGKAIASNSANMILMGQKPDAIDRISAAGELPVTGFGIEQLKSVQTNPGRFSESYLVTDRGQGIGRLVVDPFCRLLYSTRPDDVAAISSRMDTGHSIEQAVQSVLNDREGTDG